MIFAHIFIISFLFFFPIIVIFSALFYSLKKRILKDTIFLVLGITIFLFLLAMVFKFTINIMHEEDCSRLHARYYNMIFPFFIFSIIIFFNKIKINKWFKYITILVYLIVMAGNFFYFFLLYLPYRAFIIK